MYALIGWNTMEDPPTKDSPMLKSKREFESFRIRQNVNERVCILWRILDTFIVSFGSWVHVIKQAM